MYTNQEDTAPRQDTVYSTVHVCLNEPEEASKFNHTSLVERAIKCFATADSCFEKKDFH